MKIKWKMHQNCILNTWQRRWLRLAVMWVGVLMFWVTTLHLETCFLMRIVSCENLPYHYLTMWRRLMLLNELDRCSIATIWYQNEKLPFSSTHDLCYDKQLLIVDVRTRFSKHISPHFCIVCDKIKSMYLSFSSCL